jgi:hypothetical protein
MTNKLERSQIMSALLVKAAMLEGTLEEAVLAELPINHPKYKEIRTELYVRTYAPEHYDILTSNRVNYD